MKLARPQPRPCRVRTFSSRKPLIAVQLDWPRCRIYKAPLAIQSQPSTYTGQQRLQATIAVPESEGKLKVLPLVPDLRTKDTNEAIPRMAGYPHMVKRIGPIRQEWSEPHAEANSMTFKRANVTNVTLVHVAIFSSFGVVSSPRFLWVERQRTEGIARQ